MDIKNKDLLNQALTHSSMSKDKNNERLEFLGDRVLGLIISEILYKSFPNETEGDLAKRLAYLVCTETLGDIALQLNLHEKVKVSKELQSNLESQTHLLANTVEALLGGYYLDQGLEKTKEFIQKTWDKRILEMNEPPKDAKSELQEKEQQAGHPVPIYTLIERTGEDHAPLFVIEVQTSQGTARGDGKTKKEAAQNAAQNMLEGN
ncbi:MAG: ribonuclease III [Alphaproteobacteria bacterium]|nr:ribonuclease III [Alphaproteobacteria bacterium]